MISALKWTRAPSTPRAARSIFATFPSTCALPSGGRWSLRRVLQRPARQGKRCSAMSSCVPSADEFWGALLTPVLQRAVRSAALGDEASALSTPSMRRRMRERRLGGPSQRSQLKCHDGAGHDVVLPRETRSSGQADAGTLPRLQWCWASTTGARRSWPRMQAARSPRSDRCPKRRRSCGFRGRTRWISRPSARPPIAMVHGPERPSIARRAVCKERVTGKQVVSRGIERMQRPS